MLGFQAWMRKETTYLLSLCHEGSWKRSTSGATAPWCCCPPPLVPTHLQLTTKLQDPVAPNSKAHIKDQSPSDFQTFEKSLKNKCLNEYLRIEPLCPEALDRALPGVRRVGTGAQTLTAPGGVSCSPQVLSGDRAGADRSGLESDH